MFLVFSEQDCSPASEELTMSRSIRENHTKQAPNYQLYFLMENLKISRDFIAHSLSDNRILFQYRIFSYNNNRLYFGVQLYYGVVYTIVALDINTLEWTQVPLSVTNCIHMFSVGMDQLLTVCTQEGVLTTFRVALR